MGGKCKLVAKNKEKRAAASGELYWVKMLLQSKFFGSCDSHDQQKKNVFCIDCNLGFCRQYCINIHRFHRCLQICKYVYHDVLRLQDIHKHLDCSKIQTYKINGEKAVHLNPRPQSKDSKPSTKLKTGATCQACGRYLQDHPNRFCSIACKVWVVEMEGRKLEEKIDDDDDDDDETSTAEEEEEDEEEEEEDQKKSSSSNISWTDFCDEEQQVVVEYNYHKIINKRSFKRKGVPRRAPLR